MVADNLLCYINDSLLKGTAKQYKIPVSTIDSHDVVKYGVSSDGKSGVFVYSEGYEVVDVYFFDKDTEYEEYPDQGKVHFSKLGDDFMVIITKKIKDDGYATFRTIAFTGDVWFEFCPKNPRYFRGILGHDWFTHITVPSVYIPGKLKSIDLFTSDNDD